MNKDRSANGGCEEVRGSLDAYLGDELNEQSGRRIAAHLAQCPSCSAELDARTGLRVRLKAAVENQSVPPDLQARVRRSLESHKSRSWLDAGWARWSLAAAAAACLVVASFAIVNSRRLPVPTLADRPGQQAYIQKVSATLSGVLRVGLGDHIHCSIFRKYPANPPSLEQMASTLGPAYLGLISLAKAAFPPDYRVVLAHQCSFAGRKYVHITLRKGKDLVSLVIAKKQPGESLAGLSETQRAGGVAVYQASADAYEVAGFDAGDYLAFVISELHGPTNLQIAANLAPSVHQFLMNTHA
jgi:anti-sigma factor (TIGR02949 family)